MAKLYNLARVSTATTGIGPITLGPAVQGFLTFAQAGVANGDVVGYSIRDGANSEIGKGTYTSATQTLTRTVRNSTNAGSAISLSGDAEVFITPSWEDLQSEITLRSGAVFNWDDGDVLLTHSANALALTGGDIGITARATSATPLTLTQFSTSQSAALLSLGIGNSAAASGTWIMWERPASVSNNSRNWRSVVNHNRFNDGSGVGGENYTNETVALGWNLSATIGTPATAAAAAFWDTWEYKFNIGGKYHCERHMTIQDASGTQHRVFSFAGSHDGTTATGVFAVDYWSFNTYGNNTQGVVINTAQPDVTLVNAANSREAKFRLAGGGKELLQFGGSSGISNVQIGTDIPAAASGAYLDIAATTASFLQGTVGLGVAGISSAWAKIAAGTTAKAVFNVPNGAAPSSPNAGDFWSEANSDTGWKVRLNGNTRTFAWLESANTFSGATIFSSTFTQGSDATDRVAIKGFYMTPANVSVAVPSIANDVAENADSVAVDVSGAFSMQPAVGDAVIAIPQAALPTDCLMCGAYVTNTDEITVTFASKEGGGGVTGASVNFKFLVLDLT